MLQILSVVSLSECPNHIFEGDLEWRRIDLVRWFRCVGGNQPKLTVLRSRAQGVVADTFDFDCAPLIA
jgi:hypothetical protein